MYCVSPDYLREWRLGGGGGGGGGLEAYVMPNLDYYLPGVTAINLTRSLMCVFNSIIHII